MRIPVLVLFSIILCCAATGQQTDQQSSARQAHRPRQSTAPQPSANSQTVDVQGLASDLARMHALLRQMEMNLVYLPAGQTPVKHQFELELDMWRLVIDQMDRKVQSLIPQPAPTP